VASLRHAFLGPNQSSPATGFFEADRQPPAGGRIDQAGGAVGPFDEAEVGVEVILQTDAFKALHPIQVGVHHGRDRVECLDQVKGRGAHCAQETETGKQPTNPSRLACPQRTFEQDDVAGAKRGGKIRCPRTCRGIIR